MNDYGKDYAINVTEPVWRNPNAEPKSLVMSSAPRVVRTANVEPIKIRPTVNLPPTQLRGRAAAKTRTVLGLAIEGVLWLLALFTFIGGLIFVDVPLVNLVLKYFNQNVIQPVNSWYLQNGQDSLGIVSALAVAGAIVLGSIVVTLVLKHDVDIKIKKFFVNWLVVPVTFSLLWVKNLFPSKKT